jgi:hypothetical protein
VTKRQSERYLVKGHERYLDEEGPRSFEEIYRELLLLLQGGQTVGADQLRKIFGYTEYVPRATVRHYKTDFNEWLEEIGKPVTLVSAIQVRYRFRTRLEKGRKKKGRKK